jgi:membrane fusion protein (multidrug efflux system)
VPIYDEFVARTQAIQTVELRARVEGFLEQVRFQQGALVKEGQLLFVIEQPPYKAALQSAKAQLAQAQADLTRAQEPVEVLRARAQLAQQRASLAKARQDVARLLPLARDRAVPQQDLDTAVATEQAEPEARRVAEPVGPPGAQPLLEERSSHDTAVSRHRPPAAPDRVPRRPGLPSPRLSAPRRVSR